jgi:hypothetical protein
VREDGLQVLATLHLSSGMRTVRSDPDFRPAAGCAPGPRLTRPVAVEHYRDMFRAGDGSIGAAERRPEGPRRRHRRRRQRTIAGLAALLLGLGACGGASTRGGQPATPGTATPGGPAMTAPGPEAGQGTATPAPSPGTGDAPASTPVKADAGDAPAPAPVTSEDGDERLIASVRRAVAERVAPEEVAVVVGKKPLVNTRGGLPIAVLRRVKLVPDQAHANEPLDLASAEAVMYWARPVDSLDPHFVGIQFRKDGTRSLFFAILLPP